MASLSVTAVVHHAVTETTVSSTAVSETPSPWPRHPKTIIGGHDQRANARRGVGEGFDRAPGGRGRQLGGAAGEARGVRAGNGARAGRHQRGRGAERYGPKAISIISGNPYRLAIDVWGVGFRTADRIAASMGITRDSQERLQAALLQTLRGITEQGNCYAIAEDLSARAARLLIDDDDREGEE